MKKYIFLDFDGVLNSENNFSKLQQQGLPFADMYGYLFDSSAVECLRKIIEQTNAEIVVSSTWRIEGLQHLQTMWEERNLPGKLHSVTPFCQLPFIDIDMDIDELLEKGKISCGSRGTEIAEWLSTKSPREYTYVILDDLNDMLPEQKEHFVQIDPKTGITEKNIPEIIEILQTKI